MRVTKLKQSIGSRINKHTLKFLIVGVFVFALGVFVGQGNIQLLPHSGYGNTTELPKTLDFSSVNQVYDSILQNYNGTLTEQQMIDGLKHGLAQATGDPYTEFFTAKEATKFNSDLQGISLVGIGAQLDQNPEGQIVVMSPIVGSPAAAAGIQAKDIITSVDGKTTTGMSVNDAVMIIRGKKGTKVTLGIVRDGQLSSVVITRDTITVPTATGKMLDNHIGYLQVSQFSDDTYGLVQQAVTKLQNDGAKKIVLDLRDNPGGEVESAQQISSLWLNNNALIMQQRRGTTVVEEYRAIGAKPLKGVPTVVLINGGSASAAEITALALHDNKAATLMGEKSYGKGVMQTIISFGDGSELKVTIAKWYSPSGTNVSHKGITPDKVVTFTADDAKAGNDVQLQAAEAYLNK